MKVVTEPGISFVGFGNYLIEPGAELLCIDRETAYGPMSNGLQPNSNGLQPTSDGFQPNSFNVFQTDISQAGNLDALIHNLPDKVSSDLPGNVFHPGWSRHRQVWTAYWLTS